MKRGQVDDIMGTVTGFMIVFIIIALTFVMSLMGGVDATFHYQVDEVTRFQTCDTSLLNLLYSTVPGETYDFADAIAHEQDVEQEMQNILDIVYDTEVIDAHIVILEGCCVDRELCCSQYIAMWNGGSQEVCLSG